MIGMLPKGSTHMGVDNSATAGRGNKIIEYMRQKEITPLQDAEARMLLGGETAPFHRGSPCKKRWNTMKDGDLWQGFMRTVKAKGPWAVWLSKVKGHATSEQVETGEVEPADKAGNDEADEAADKGSKDEQEHLEAVAMTYSTRNKAYQNQ